MGDCATKPGNSGAPIINSNNEVVAVSSSTFKPDFIELITQGRHLIEGKAFFSKAENVACMDLQYANAGDIVPTCRNHSLNDPYVFRHRQNEHFDKTIAKATQQLNTMLRSENIFLKWTTAGSF